MDTHTLIAVLVTIGATLAVVGLASHFGWIGASQNLVAQLELKTEADALHLVARAVTFLGSTKQFDDAIAAAQAQIAQATAGKAARAQLTQQVMVLMQGIAAVQAPAANAAPAAPVPAAAAQS